MKKLIFAFICLFLAIPLQARIITVDDDGPADFSNIQAAISDSNDDDTIIVAPGTYTGTGNRNIDFTGKAITVRSSDPNDPNIVAATIINCQNAGRGFYFQNNEDANSIVAGFTITNGYGGNYGGGIYCFLSNPTIANCIITSSTAGYNGGGIHCAGSPIITNCTITGNTAGKYGGGISCSQSSSTITNCTVSNNRGLIGIGGGIYCSQGSPAITNCNITGNLEGGIYCKDSNANITACTISNNSGSGIGSDYDSYPTVTDCNITCNSGNGIAGCNGPITNCTITGNVAEEKGGGLYGCNGPITNCIISGNAAEREGGGLYGCHGPVTNCIINGNSAGEGGGLAECYGSVTNCIISNNDAGYDGGGLAICNNVTNCTIIGNIAGLSGDYHNNDGGGIYSVSEVTNCIIWDNWPDQIYISGVTYSNVQGGWTGQGNIDADPCLAFNSDYHITPASPCIDAGTNDPCGGLPSTDIDGTPRPLDGNGDGNAVADMGAYEFIPDSPFIAVSAVNLYFTQDWPNLDPQTRTLLIRNCGGQPLHWQIIEDCNWLQVSPASGISTGQISEVNITVDPNGLAPGTYSCDFSVQDINASNNPVTISVTMPIGQVLLVPQDFNTIQKAIDAAENANIVLVADGNYTGAGNKNLDFRGKIITVRSENGPNNCIIDCHGSDPGFHFQNRESQDSIVDGFTIANATAGIYCSCRSNPTIKNCIIRNSSSPPYGGIICEVFSNPAIAGCNISGNYGYGIYYGFNASPILGNMLNAIITDSTISNNKAGGVLAVNCKGNLKVTNCTITGNLNSGEHGGGIFCLNPPHYNPEDGYTGVSLEITNSIVSGNTYWQVGAIICGDGSKIIDCNISGNHGTGIYCTSNTTVADCTITGNSARTTSGAGIYCYGGSDTIITNCTITGNTATLYAGGIRHKGRYEEKNNLTIINCIISGNSAGKAEAGISCVYPSNPIITNCTVTGNTAVEYGGGISCSDDSNATITDCNISGNSAGSSGGGVYCKNSSPTIRYCTIKGNSAGSGGGLYDCDGPIKNCSITGNSSSRGGGLYDCDSPIKNCIISDNIAQNGGGLFGCDGPITNCTITGNSAIDSNARGGGLASCSGPITNCIIWYNVAAIGSQLYGSTEPTYSCIQDWTSVGVGNINADPCFVQPGYWADANDPNIIVEPYDPNAAWIDGDYHLLPASPCINTGDPNYVAGPNETDLDGLPRVIGGRVDMGAYEFNHQPVAVAGPNQVVFAWINGFADVNLDASASFDDDNDVLDYYWSWTIDGNTYEANDITPTIELPVGKHTIELVVDDGIDLSEPDYCTITVIKAVHGRLSITPRVIETKSRGKWILATLYLPPVVGEQVNKNELLRLYPSGIEAKYQRFSKYGMSRFAPTFALAYFDKQQVTDALGPGQFDVSVVGKFLSGRFFFGSDTIKIIAPKPKPPHYWH